MRKTYVVLAYVVALGVVWQAAGIAVALFTVMHEVEDGSAITSGYDWGENLGILMHRIGGTAVIPLGSIALLVVSFFTGLPGAVRWAGIVFGLVVLQWLILFVAFVVPNTGALHGANALVLFAAAVWAARRLRAVPLDVTTDTAPEAVARG